MLQSYANDLPSKDFGENPTSSRNLARKIDAKGPSAAQTHMTSFVSRHENADEPEGVSMLKSSRTGGGKVGATERN